jgi:hypothetical protein
MRMESRRGSIDPKKLICSVNRSGVWMWAYGIWGTLSEEPSFELWNIRQKLFAYIPNSKTVYKTFVYSSMRKLERSKLFFSILKFDFLLVMILIFSK